MWKESVCVCCFICWAGISCLFLVQVSVFFLHCITCSTYDSGHMTKTKIYLKNATTCLRAPCQVATGRSRKASKWEVLKDGKPAAQQEGTRGEPHIAHLHSLGLHPPLSPWFRIPNRREVVLGQLPSLSCSSSFSPEAVAGGPPDRPSAFRCAFPFFPVHLLQLLPFPPPSPHLPELMLHFLCFHLNLQIFLLKVFQFLVFFFVLSHLHLSDS